MTDKFIELLTKEVNKYYTCYYEEAPSSAKFPYLVMPTLTLTPVDAISYSAVFDLEIYINELSMVSVESIIDTLRTNLDGLFLLDEDFGFHISFDNQLLVKSNEQDLSIRRITFTARIFR